MQEHRSKLSELQQTSADQMFEQVRRAAAMGKATGKVPLEVLSTLPQEWAQRLSTPGGLEHANKLMDAWYNSSPKVMAATSKQASAEEQTRVRAAAALEAARLRAQNAVKSATTTASKFTFEQQSAYYNKLAFEEKDPDLKQKYQQLADQAEVQALRKAIAATTERGAGTVDISKLPGQSLPVKPGAQVSPTPRQGGQWTPPDGWK